MEMALDYILGVPGSFSGNKFRKENDEYLRRILHLTVRSRMQKYMEMLFQYSTCEPVSRVTDLQETLGIQLYCDFSNLLS